MAQLPDVRDDHKTIKKAIQMLQIPKENTFEFDNVSYQNIEATIEDVKQTSYAYTKKLQKNSGIGTDKMIMGVPWDRLRSCIDLDS